MLETCTAPLTPEQSGVLMKVMSQSQQKELFSADFTQHFPPAGPYQPGAVPPPRRYRRRPAAVSTGAAPEFAHSLAQALSSCSLWLIKCQNKLPL